MSPELIAAIGIAAESFLRNLLRDINAMTTEEQDIFIAEQKLRKADHDQWLKDQGA